MSLGFSDKEIPDTQDSNIDSSLTLNPPADLGSPQPSYSPPSLPGFEPAQGSTASSFSILSQDHATALPQEQSSQQEAQQPPQGYTPAKLFQATGDVRNLGRSTTSSSGFTVHIYDRHIRTWIPDINYSDIAIRGQLYVLWKTAWLENAIPSIVLDRDMVLDAAALTLREIQKDNNKWERNYSAARRRDWHPNFTEFYDEIFKGLWTHRVWPPSSTLPEPPRYLAEMARKITKNAGLGAGTSIHQPVHVMQELDVELSMSPVALRTLKLRVIELEGVNQGLREDLSMCNSALKLTVARAEEARAILQMENSELKRRFEEIRQKVSIP
jgi:hypothetical protein